MDNKITSKLFPNKLNAYLVEKVNTIEEMPENFEKRIYTTSRNFDNETHFFDTEDELIDFYSNHEKRLDLCIYAYDYIGDFGGKKDVIRIVDREGVFHLFTSFDEDGYLELDTSYDKKSNYEKIVGWKYRFCDKYYMKSLYDAFKDRGIVLQNDVYGKVIKRYKRILDMAK